MERFVFDLLNKIGIPCHLKGRSYIETSLKIVSEKGVIMVTKEIYPDVAKVHKTTPQRVERAIRNAIEYAFNNTSTEVLFEIFGNSINLKSRKTTNSAFIYGLFEYIKVNFKEA